MATTYERRWETRRGGGRSVADESRTSYYGLPTIHKPHWKWLIILYFFFGGLAGASYVIASVARLFGGAEGRPIERAGRYISVATFIPTPIFLIWDLGRPDRFHHMLRVVKFRSPMSIGTWGLVIFSLFSTLSAAIQAAEDGLFGRTSGLTRFLRALPARGIGALGILPGFFLSGYTGVLLAATAVPLWTKTHLLMGPLFLASSLSNAAAAILLVLSTARGTSHETLKRLERFDVMAALAELVLLLTLRARVGKTIARPLETGQVGRIHRIGVLGTGIGLPLALQVGGILRRSGLPRTVSAFSALLTLTGGFLFRYVMIIAGNQSADDPEATFDLTRQDGQRPA